MKGTPTCSKFYYLNENASDWRKFSILPNGNAKPENSRDNFPYSDYCIHYTNVSGKFRLNLRICGVNLTKMSDLSLFPIKLPFEQYQDILYVIYFVVGALFLALTLLVHMLLPELRKIEFHDAFVNHVTCLLICYTTMAGAKMIHFSAAVWWRRLSG